MTAPVRPQQDRRRRDPLDDLDFGAPDPLDALSFAPPAPTPEPTPTVALPPVRVSAPASPPTVAMPPVRVEAPRQGPTVLPTVTTVAEAPERDPSVRERVMAALGQTVRRTPFIGGAVQAADVIAPNAGEEFTKGMVGGLRQQLPEDVGSFGQVLRDVGGPEAVGRAGERLQAFGRSAAETYAPRVGSWEDVEGLRDVPDLLAWQTGSALASSSPSLALGMAGASVGGAPGAAVGAALPSYAQNVGSIRTELAQLGLEDPEKRGAIALALGVPVTALDVLTEKSVAATFVSKVMRTALIKKLAERGFLGSIGREMLKNATLEAATEVAQEELQYAGTRLASGTPMTVAEAASRGLNAATAGALAGGVMGGVGAAIPQRRAMRPEVDAAWTDLGVVPEPVSDPARLLAAPPAPPPSQPAPPTAPPMTEAEKHRKRLEELEREEMGGPPATVAPDLGEPEGGVEAFMRREAEREPAEAVARRQGLRVGRNRPPEPTPTPPAAPSPEIASGAVEPAPAPGIVQGATVRVLQHFITEAETALADPATPERRKRELRKLLAARRQELRTLEMGPSESAPVTPPAPVAADPLDAIDVGATVGVPAVESGRPGATTPVQEEALLEHAVPPTRAQDAAPSPPLPTPAGAEVMTPQGPQAPRPTPTAHPRVRPRIGTEEEALAAGYVKAHRGISQRTPFNDGSTMWLTNKEDVAEQYATEGWNYPDPDILDVWYDPKAVPTYDNRELTDEQRAALGAGGSGIPQAIGIYEHADDAHQTYRDHRTIHIPNEHVIIVPRNESQREMFAGFPTAGPKAPPMPAFTLEQALHRWDALPRADREALADQLNVGPDPFDRQRPYEQERIRRHFLQQPSSAPPGKLESREELRPAENREKEGPASVVADDPFAPAVTPQDAERQWNALAPKERAKLARTLGVKSSRFFTLTTREQRAIQAHFSVGTPVAPETAPAQTTPQAPAQEGADVEVRERVEGDAPGVQPAEVPAAPVERPTRTDGPRAGGARPADVRVDAGSTPRAEPAPEGREPGPGVGAPDAAGEPGTGDRAARAGDGERGLPDAERDRVPRLTDYRLAADDIAAIESTGQRAKARQNVDAIRLLRTLEREGRPATPEEQATLARYTGWGQFPRVFDPDPKDWGDIAAELKALVSEEEFAAMRKSTLNAHYTSPEVVRAMWRLVDRLGFTDGKVLEPSAGAGYFLGLAPEGRRLRWTATELDAITGGIAKHLYPTQRVSVQGFETLKAPEGSFDLAISNVPFGDYPIHDPRYPKVATEAIHNYFFARALDLVRPNGIVAFITSAFTLDARSRGPFRDYLADRAEFVGAIRLPDTAFKKTAGTDVVTDIIVLRRKAPGEPDRVGETFRQAQDWTTPAGVQVAVNEYFVRHPSMMLGEMTRQGTMYGSEQQTLSARKGQDTAKLLEAAIAQLPPGVYRPAERPATAAAAPVADVLAPAHLKDGNLFVADDGTIRQSVDGHALKVAMPDAHRPRVAALIAIRDQVRDALRTQVENRSDEEIDAARTALHRAWTAFVKQYGPIGKEVRTEIKRKDRDEPIIQVRYPNLATFMEDPDWSLVSSIEVYDPETDRAEPAAILTKRILEPARAPERVETVGEAIPIVLNETGTLDLPRIAQLTGIDPEKALVTLQDSELAFFNPESSALEPRDYYLSGNVKAKLAEVRRVIPLMPDGSKRYERNVRALEAVQPADLPPSKISASLGAPWIPPADVEAFIRETLHVEPWRQVTVRHTPALNKWDIDAEFQVQTAVAGQTTWGTRRVPFVKLVEHALNLTTPTVTDPGLGGGPRVKNPGETLAAEEKLQAIKDRFGAWVWEDADRATRLARDYNDRFNTDVEYRPDGSHLTLPGAAKHLPGKPDFQLAAHQKDAVWRILQNGNTGLFHVVGAGKTFTMVAAAMEARRLGLARKPLVAVPNHMLKQFSDEFRQLYPTAKLLLATEDDFAKAKRKRFTARMATQDWDAIIMTHSSFERVSVSRGFEQQMLAAQLAELEAAIREAKADRSARTIVKQIEKAAERLRVRMAELSGRERKDDLLAFEETGVDMLFVDEAHLFKNLWITSKMQGMGIEGAKRSFDLFLKTQYLDAINPGRGVVFATGTPIANAMAEAYTMQRYLQPRVLKERGLWSFDDWAATFGEPVTSLEVAVDGTYKVKTRFARYKNVGELAQMFRRVADVRTAAMLNLPRPTLLGGSAEVVTVPGTDALAAYQRELVDRADAIRKKAVLPGEDNMLKLSTDGRKAALDLRLLGLVLPETEPTKVGVAAEQIHAAWKEAGPVRGAQLVFVDFSTPGERFNVYTELRSLLTRKGIPAREIAFIHDAASDEQKKKLFAAVRAGRVRVLIGSTPKMGAGTNVQDRLVALHHLDAPWKPAEVEQRNGRILRQGNVLFDTQQIPGVRIKVYVTEGSYDTFMWQTLERKAGFIEQFMAADASTREVEEVGQVEVDWATAKAIASGDPTIMEKARVDMEVAKLKRLESQHRDSQFALQREVKSTGPHLAFLRDKLTALEADRKAAVETKGDAFTIVVRGKRLDARPEAGATLRKEVDTFLAGVAASPAIEHPTREIGTFAGFRLAIAAGRSTHSVNAALTFVELTLIGEMHHAIRVEAQDSPQSIVASLEALPRRIPTLVEETTSGITFFEKRERELREQVGKPFEHADKLAALLKEQAALDERLRKAGEEAEAKRTGRGALPTAEQYAATLNANVDAWMAGTITKEEFNRVQRETWDEIAKRGDAMQSAVSALVDPTKKRKQPPPEPPSGEGGYTTFSFIDPISAAVAQGIKVAQAYRARQTARQQTIAPFADPDVEQRWQESKGLPVPGLRDKVKAALEAIRGSVRHFPTIDVRDNPVAAAAYELLLGAERAPAWSQAQAYTKLADITDGLAPNELDLFTRALVLPDILKDIEAGLYAEGKALPFGFTDALHVEREAQRIEAEVAKHPKVQAALDARQAFALDLTIELVDLDLLDAKVLEDDRYYHRQVLEHYEAMDPAFVGTGTRDVRTHKKGFQKRRTGGGDFNTQYHEAEFEWVAQAYAQLKIRRTLLAMKRLADIRPQLRQEAKALGRDPDEIEIPDGYREWQPEKGNYWFRAITIQERVLDQILAGQIDAADATFRTLLAMGQRKPAWIIPDWLARAMDRFAHERPQHALERGWIMVENAWKQWTLLSPSRLLRYNLNNFSGDLDATILYPGILRYVGTAAEDVYAQLIAPHTPQGNIATPAVKAEMLRAIEYGVLDNTLTVAEIPDITELPRFKSLITRPDSRGLPGRVAQRVGRGVAFYWQWVKLLTRWRENTFRLAAWRYFRDRLAAGDTSVYGASNRQRVEAEPDLGKRAAILARDLIGDYGDISSAGVFLRQRVFPFFSWVELNAKRYVRVFRNIPHEAGSTRYGRLAGAVGARAGAKAVTTGIRAAELVILANAFFLLVNLWNRWLFPDEEEELRREGRNLHLILGRTEDGRIRWIRVEGAFADFLEWVNLQDYPTDAAELAEGTATFAEKAEEAVLAPVNKVAQMWEPWSKTLFEAYTRRTVFPDVFNPRPIRDRGEYVARVLSVDGLYRRVTGKPTPAKGGWLERLVLYQTDPGEASYYAIRERGADFMEEHGHERGSTIPTERDNALYYWRKAVQWGDEEAAAKWLARYRELGGRGANAAASIERARPLSFMPARMRGPFVESLSAEEHAMLVQADAWWRRMYVEPAGRSLRGEPAPAPRERTMDDVMRSGFADTLTAAVGRPDYTRTLPDRSVPGRGPQLGEQGRDLGTLRTWVGLTQHALRQAEPEVDRALAHEMGHLAASLDNPVNASQRANPFQTQLHRLAQGRDPEAFAEDFMRAATFLRGRSTDVRSLPAGAQAIVQVLLTRPIYRDHPLNRHTA